jgi:hypothetical protein
MQQRQQEVSNWRQGGSKSGDMRCPPGSDDANVRAVGVATLQGQVRVLAHAAEQRNGPLDLWKRSKWPKYGEKRWSHENEEMEGKEDDGVDAKAAKGSSAHEEGNPRLTVDIGQWQKVSARRADGVRKSSPRPISSSSRPFGTAPLRAPCKPRMAVAMSNKPWAVWWRIDGGVPPPRCVICRD